MRSRLENSTASNLKVMTASVTEVAQLTLAGNFTIPDANPPDLFVFNAVSTPRTITLPKAPGGNLSLTIRIKNVSSGAVDLTINDPTGPTGVLALPQGQTGIFTSVGAAWTGGAVLGVPAGIGTGNVTAVGTPTNGQIGVWTGATTLSGVASIPAAGVTGTAATLTVADQVLSGGCTVTTSDQGTKSTGTYTVDPGVCPLQRIINGGTFTLAAPAADGSMILLVTNNSTAGTITFSGFSVGSNTGDALTTTNTQKFSIHIWRINGVSGYRVAAHQ